MELKKWLLVLHRYAVLYFVRFLVSFKGAGQKVKPTIKNHILQGSATALAAKIRTKQLSSVEVMKTFIERIKEVNPILNCVVDNRFEEALKDAATADQLIASGKFSEAELERDQPYLGVPISTKDCLAVKGLIHTAGLVARKHIRAEKDCDAIALMRQAGAIPFALTNVSECCMWWESNNPVHGISNNPYDTHRIVGGSSGGEGCLLAASGSPIGIGSDIGGSIRMPAFFNGIFGHKPSKFIVSNAGQWPQPHNDTLQSFLGVGPMSRYAADLKPVLKVIAGTNAAKLNLDEPVDISNVKIFYQTNDGGAPMISYVDDDIAEAMNKVIDHFSRISKRKPQRKQIKLLKKSTVIWMGNMKSPPGLDNFDTQLLNLQGRINPWMELLKWIVGKSNHTFIAVATALSEKLGVKYGSSKHQYLVKKKDELIKEFDSMLGDDGVFLYPAHPTVAPYHHEPIARAFNFSYTGIINVMGLPATSIPLGVGREGLPVGIQVIGNVNQDRLCLAVANELERAFGGWKEPGKA